MKYYPALWYDIGAETAAARNALFGFRAQLYAENYIGRVAAWCEAHGIDMSGHQDQEEVRNPVGIHGDLMKVFEHQQIPGVDDIYYNGRSNVGYKVVTSSAFNWDKPIVMAETYAFPERDPVTAGIRPVVDDFKNYFANHNASGGRSYFLPQPNIKLLNTVLKEAVPVRGVDIQQPPMWPVKIGPEYDGALTYIHKVKDGKDIYFFANSRDAAVDTKMVLRGAKKLALWNPHTGERMPAESTQSEQGGQAVTTVRLALDAVTAVFFIQE